MSVFWRFAVYNTTQTIFNRDKNTRLRFLPLLKLKQFGTIVVFIGGCRINNVAGS
jgi:hypothetical protein